VAARIAHVLETVPIALLVLAILGLAAAAGTVVVRLFRRQG